MNRRLAQQLITLLITLFGLVVIALANEDEGEDTLMAFFGTNDTMPMASPDPLLMNIYNRNIQSLNGAWEIYVDEPGMGYRALSLGSFISEQQPAKTGMELIEVAFDSRNQLQVPGDWNSQIPELDRYRGRVIYHKAFDVKKQNNQRYFLHFGAANYKTEVFVNGQLMGRHDGGYTAFNFDVTDQLKSGTNVVMARVNAFLDDSDIPTMRTSDFWKYGGITRDVSLVSVPSTYIGQYHVYLSDRESSEITAWVQLQGKNQANKRVNINIPEAGIKASGKTDSDGRVRFKVKAEDLQLWYPASPKLYDVVISTDKSQLKDRIGFRTIKTQGQNIVLNGKPIKLYGISMHEETILRPGLANSKADAEASLGLIKELGANFVRLAHYPHNEHTLKLADELGIMVWSEIPIVSSIDWTNEQTLKVAQSQITENVSRDLNRAAIVMWSIANETFPKTDERLEFLTSLADIARTLDESDRPVAAALIGNFQEEFGAIIQRVAKILLAGNDLDAETRAKLEAKFPTDSSNLAEEGLLEVAINDPLGEVVDIVGYNEYFGWYYSAFFAPMLGVDESLIREAMFKIMPDIRFSNVFGKPMIISEFGAGAKYGFHSEEGLIWSEEYQVKVYENQLAMLEKSEMVQGMSPWVLKDFRSHMRGLNGIQDTYNRKGLVSEKGEKKLVFDVLKEYYTSAP